jgi:hypothetical protein
MPMFLVMRRQAGPQFDRTRPLEQQSRWAEHARFMDDLVARGFIILGGPLSDDGRVALAVEAASPLEIEQTLARDPWHASHLVVDSIERWTIRLDGRSP